MPSHSEVAKRIFNDAKARTSQHEDSAQWDLLNGLADDSVIEMAFIYLLMLLALGANPNSKRPIRITT